MDMDAMPESADYEDTEKKEKIQIPKYLKGTQ